MNSTIFWDITPFQRTTRYYIPEDRSLHIHDNIRASHILVREDTTRQMKSYLSRQTEECGQHTQDEIDTKMH
jgi:hypothetical protein